MRIKAEPLDPATFAPFGDVIDTQGAADRLINAGRCGRFHDRARIDVAGGHAGLSLFQSEAVGLPYACDLLERHPLGSQAFIPMYLAPFMVIVAEDDGGTPGEVRAFVSLSGQAVNILRNTWHGVLTPLYAPGLFAVVDYVGEDDNLEEHRLETPVEIRVEGYRNPPED